MCVCVCVCVRACSVAQSCPTLLQPHGLYSPLGSSVHGLFQARILEWVAISSFRRSSRLRNRTLISFVSCIGRWILYHLPPLLTIITSLALSLTNIFSVIEWRDFPTGDSHLQEALANGTWHAVGTCSLWGRSYILFTPRLGHLWEFILSSVSLSPSTSLTAVSDYPTWPPDCGLVCSPPRNMI